MELTAFGEQFFKLILLLQS